MITPFALKYTTCARSHSASFLGSYVTQPSPHAPIFTALHGMQTRSSHENSVYPSVKRVLCDKTKWSSAQIIIPYERTFIL